MNNEDIQKQILLRDSGELSQTAAAHLDALMVNDPELMAYAKDVKQLRSAGQEALGIDGPAPDVVQRIITQAKRGGVDLRPVPMARRTMQVLSYAAALVLAFGLWRFHLDLQRADRINEMSSMLTFVEDSQDGASLHAQPAEDLEALAELLLEIEGLALDDDVDAWDDEEGLTPPAAHLPTAIQEHSIRAFPAKIYG